VRPLRAAGDVVTHHRLVWTPRAKQRPQHTFQGGHHRTFTPRETRSAEAALAQQWVGQPVAGPIAVSIVLTDTSVDVCISPCPEPTSAKLRRGDIDNYTKLILDALNKVAWIDDRQIAAISVRKL
jgi:Holliday junction resolvase RusA-like endonuclease